MALATGRSNQQENLTPNQLHPAGPEKTSPVAPVS